MRVEPALNARSSDCVVFGALVFEALRKNGVAAGLPSRQPPPGVKYIRFMIDEFYENEPMTKLDKVLFGFAAYNAGPGRVAHLRREAAKRGLDPNVWFLNVEYIAAEKIGPETVTYVSNIFKYYVAYQLIEDELQERQEVKESLKGGSK